jgi:hypothetical protein
MHERKGATEEVRPDEAGRDETGTAEEGRRGPRGGTTTVSASGFVKKNFWVSPGAAEQMRRVAFETRRSEADILRAALDRFLAEGQEEAG